MNQYNPKSTTMLQLNENTFELDYLFTESKDVFSPFRSVGTFYSLLHDFDRYVLLNIHSDLKVEYRLEHVEYGSLKTRVVQVINSVPDQLLIDPELQKIIGTLLIESKYWLLERLSTSNAIESKSQVEGLAEKINKRIGIIGKKSQTLVHTISPHAVLNSLAELSQETNKLPKKEAYEYKSKFGSALLKSGTKVNKAIILSELGQRTETSETKEVIKPKKVDLIGTSKWECILDGRTREMKVEDKEWLDKYHKRKIDIQSGDSLKVELRTTYSYNANSSKTKVTYDIIRVLGVIKPDDSIQLTL